jgi:parvulin-like peptidyl-prolyl isomerase
MKWIIVIIVALFVISIFFIGAAGIFDLMAAKGRDQAAQANLEKSLFDPAFDLSSTKLVASVTLEGNSDEVTEGDVNRRLVELGMSLDKLKTFPEYYLNYFKSQIKDQLVAERLLYLQGKKNNIDVEASVVKRLESTKQGHERRQPGSFAKFLKFQGYKSEEEFRRILERGEVVRALRGTLFEGIKVSDEDIAYYYKINKEKYKDANGNVPELDKVKEVIRAELKSDVNDEVAKKYYEEHKARWMEPRKIDASYIMLSEREPKNLEELKKGIDEAQLQKYYADNKDDFLKPEKAKVTHIFIDNTKLREKVTVTDEALKAQYEKDKDAFSHDGLVQAHHILLKVAAGDDKADKEALAKIEKIKEEILTKKITFEDAAKKYSTCPSGKDGGDLGHFGREDMVKEFDDYSFNGPIGKVSEPVKTKFGYHLIRIDSREEKGFKPLSAVKARLEESVKDVEQDKKADEIIAEIQKQLKEKTASFEQLAEKYSDAPSAKTQGVVGEIYIGQGNEPEAIKELSTDGTTVDNGVMNVLKTLKLGEVSDPVVTGAGTHLLKIDEKKPAETKAFTEVKDVVEKKVLDKKLAEQYEKTVKEVQTALEGQSIDFKALVKKYSDSKVLDTVAGIMLDAETFQEIANKDAKAELCFNDKLDGTILSHLQYSEEGKVTKPLEMSGKTFWFRVDKRYPAEYKAFPTVKDAVVDAIALRVSQKEVSDYYKENEKDYYQQPKIVLQQIMYNDENVAKTQLDAIKKGLPFKKAGMSHLNIQKANFEKTEGKVELDNINFFDEKTQKMITDLKEGQMCPVPLKSKINKWHIVRMVQNAPAKQLSVNEVTAQIAEKLREKKREDVFKSYIQELRNKAEKIVMY